MSEGSQLGLLRANRFGPLFATQLLGAFNDNAYKNALLILITFQLAAPGADTNTLVNVAAALFIAPFFAFSALAGQLADKYEKSALIRRIKLAEIAIMAIGAVGFLAGSVTVLMLVLFMMGTQSAFFGPLKYGILPQHLRPGELMGGNGLIEMGTFVAILVGTLVGGVLVQSGDASAWLVSATVIGVALAGYLASRAIPLAPAVAPDLRVGLDPVSETWRLVKFTAGNRTVFLSVLGISWFWFYGALLLTQLPNYVRDVLNGTGGVAVVMLTTFSLGIGTGSLLCERLSGRRVELGLVPFGAILMAVFGLDLSFADPAPPVAAIGAGDFLARAASWRVIADLVLLSVAGGIYVVPLYTLVQHRSEPGHRSRVIAANNVLNALFMVVAAAVAVGLLGAGLTIPQLFLVVALMHAAVAVFIFRQVPEFLMRFIVWMTMRTLYTMDRQDLHHVPEEGAALLVCNHVSLVDALVLAAASERPLRFVVDRRLFDAPLLGFVLRTGKAIPIATAREDPVTLERGLDEIAVALEGGELVCIFPEGTMTPDGAIGPFRTGLERIVARSPVPVVPLALRGLWGSWFSRAGGRAMGGMPWPWKVFFHRVDVMSGPPLSPAEADAPALREIVAGLRGEWR